MKMSFTSRAILLPLICLFSLLFCTGTRLHAQDDATYIGVWRAGNTKEIIRGGSTDYQKLVPHIPDRGVDAVILDHKVRINGRQIYHYGIWTAGRSSKEKSGNWQTISAFVAANSQSTSRGMNFITQLEAYQNPTTHQTVFQVVYGTANRQRQILQRSSTWESFVSTWKDMLRQNMRLKRVVSYEEKGSLWFVGLYNEGNHGHYMFNLTGWSNFSKKWEELGKKNYRLVDLDTYTSSSGKIQYIGIWEPGNDGYYLWSVKGFNNFVKKFNELNGKFDLVDLEVVYAPGSGLRVRID